MTDQLVTTFVESRLRPRAVAPPSQTMALSLAEAYAVQDRLRETLVARGERVAGWKAAFTNAVMQQSYGTTEPVCAFLLASGVLGNGAAVAMSRFVSPVVEAEIAFVMRSDLAGPGVTPPRALRAIEGALPALELPDFRMTGKLTGTDLVADGIFANAVVLGAGITPIANVDLALEGLVYELNGSIVATNTAAEVLGNPLHSVVWLANHLGGRGLGLAAGDIVMTGSISQLLRPKAGETVRATFTRLGSVSVRFV